MARKRRQRRSKRPKKRRSRVKRRIRSVRKRVSRKRRPKQRVSKRRVRRKVKIIRRGRKKKIKISKRIRIKIRKPYPRRYLRNVSPENSLWIINGDIIKSLRELLKELKIMNDEAFRFHINKERNDFSKWIREVIGDRKLAVEFKKVKTRDKAIKAINNRIK